jgi:hypothetical protein
MSSHEAPLQLTRTDLPEPLAVRARRLVCEQRRQIDYFPGEISCSQTDSHRAAFADWT